MSAARARVTLTIASGQTLSTKLSAALSQAQIAAFGSLADIIVYMPAALTGTVTLQLAATPGGTLKNAYDLTAAADITLPAAKAIQLPHAAFGDLAFLSGSAEGADRTFEVVIQASL